jgi:hypothetical protein
MSATTPAITLPAEGQSVAPARTSTVPSWLGLLLAAGLLLAHIPYRGVRHDGELYLAQAFSHIDPDWARADLFFVGGFQDHYSLFSNIFAFVLRHVEVGVTCIAFLLAAWALNLWALVRLGAGMPMRERWLAVFAVLGASHFYGAARMIGYFENFVTGRTWAEPFALLALASFVGGRRRWAIALLALAVLMHPLIALPVGLVFFVMLVGEDRRWAWLAMVIVPVVVLALAGVAPFGGLLRVYDLGWLDTTRSANTFVFLGNWSRPDFVAASVFLAILWAANAGITSPLARASRAAGGVAIAMCVVSYIGADLLHDVLITQLQLWRALWVANLLAVFSLPSWLMRLWAQGTSGRLAAAAVFVAVATADAWLSTGWALAAWAVLTLVLHRRAVVLKPSITRLAMGATIFVGLMLCLLQTQSAQGQIQMHMQGMAIARPSSIPFTLMLLTLPLMYAFVRAWESGGRARRVGVVGCGAALLLFGLSQWDQRTSWERYIEQTPRGSHPFDAIVPKNAQVYWHEELKAPWFLLGRPSFIGVGQLAGVLFSRDTALVSWSRVNLLRAVMANADECEALEWLGQQGGRLQACQLPRDAFFNMCRGQPDAADFLIASTDFGTGVVARWTFAPHDAPPVTYALYDCKRVVAATPGTHN